MVVPTDTGSIPRVPNLDFAGIRFMFRSAGTGSIPRVPNYDFAGIRFRFPPAGTESSPRVPNLDLTITLCFEYIMVL